MGCRSALSPWKDENGQYKFYGRFNQGVVTINLVDVALSSGGDMDKFWKIFDDRLDLCYRALMCRHNRLKGTLSDAAPILWQSELLHGCKRRDDRQTALRRIFHNISRLCRAVRMCEIHDRQIHTDPEATPFALDVMKHMMMRVTSGKRRRTSDSVFMDLQSRVRLINSQNACRKRFGIVPGVTDKSYITNS